MFCPKCGTQMPDNCLYCPSCGSAQSYTAPTPVPQPVSEAPVITEKIKKWIGSGYFLAIAILSTVAIISAVVINTISLFTGLPSSGGAGLFAILTCIAMWVAYGSARSENGKASSGLGFSHGILTAKFIISWIGVAVIAATLVICLIMIPIANVAMAEIDRDMGKKFDKIFEDYSEKGIDVEDGIDKLIDEAFSDKEFIREMESAGIKMDRDDVEEFFESYGYDAAEFMLEWTKDHTDNFFTSFVNLILIVTVIALAFTLVYTILVNVLVTRKLKNFAGQLNNAYLRNETRELNFSGVKGALIANGIFSLSNPVSAAASFVGAALVGKMKEDIEN